MLTNAPLVLRSHDWIDPSYSDWMSSKSLNFDKLLMNVIRTQRFEEYLQGGGEGKSAL